MDEKEAAARERVKEIAEKFIAEGNPTGWFDALYKEAKGDNEKIPWADLEPNKFLVRFAEATKLQGNGRNALVVGCGLGDDARFLQDRGFRVTGFDISATAIEWAKRICGDNKINFFVADLFSSPKEWNGAFDFVLEVYTIQPLPLSLRESAIDEIAKFVKKDGKLLVVTRAREDNEEVTDPPWPLSKKDLSRFEKSGLKQIHFEEMFGDEEEPMRRFVVEYEKS